MYQKLKMWFLYAVSFLIALGLILTFIFLTVLVGFIKVGLKTVEYIEELIKKRIKELDIFSEENKAL